MFREWGCDEVILARQIGRSIVKDLSRPRVRDPFGLVQTNRIAGTGDEDGQGFVFILWLCLTRLRSWSGGGVRSEELGVLPKKGSCYVGLRSNLSS